MHSEFHKLKSAAILSCSWEEASTLICPRCGGKVQTLKNESAFCLDCEWDNLEQIPQSGQQVDCKHLWVLQVNQADETSQWRCVHCSERRDFQMALMYLRP